MTYKYSTLIWEAHEREREREVPGPWSKEEEEALLSFVKKRKRIVEDIGWRDLAHQWHSLGMGFCFSTTRS